jgi:hypothetical protein
VSDQAGNWVAPGGGSDGWAAPGADGRPTPPAPPRYGERLPAGEPGFPPSFAPTPPPPPGIAPAPGAYVPPPKPGLIPLHPLSFGRLLGSAFAVLRWNPVATILPSLAIQVLQVVLVYGLGALIGFSAADRIAQATDADRGAIIAGTIAEGVVGGLLALAVAVFGGALLQGVVVVVVARGTLGEKPGVGAVLKRARRSVLPLAGYAVLLGLAEIIAVGLVVLLVVLAAAAGNTAGVVVAVLTGVLGGLGLLVLIAWLTVKLALVPSAIVLEHLGIRAGIARSWVLIRGSFWRTFGLIILLMVILGVAAQIVNIPFSILGSVLSGILAPNGSDSFQGTIGAVLISTVPSLIVASLVGAITGIAEAAARALVYLDLRMRREGLDLELRRAVESQEPTEDAFASAPR